MILLVNLISFLLLGLLLFLIPGCSSTAGHVKTSNEPNFYYISGEINANTFDSIIKILKANHNKQITFVANSSGGWITGINDAMDSIREHGDVNWLVPRGSICNSACALLAISSNRIDGELGFHSLFATYKGHRYMMYGDNAKLVDKMISYGYPRELVEKLLNSVNIFYRLSFKEGKLIGESLSSSP